MKNLSKYHEKGWLHNRKLILYLYILWKIKRELIIEKYYNT